MSLSSLMMSNKLKLGRVKILCCGLDGVSLQRGACPSQIGPVKARPAMLLDTSAVRALFLSVVCCEAPPRSANEACALPDDLESYNV